MKITPSRYVLIAEIAIIILFHLAKINQADKRTRSSIAESKITLVTNLHTSDFQKRTGLEYLLASLIK